MEAYKTRRIAFREVLRVDGWRIKTYTIAKHGTFDQPEFYENAKTELPRWLSMRNGFNPDHEHMGFLILHQGTEGIFSIVCWWVDSYMLNTHIFITPHGQPDEFRQISGDGLAPCIWELEVVNHERLAWMRHVLKRAPQPPDYPAYLADVFDKEM